MRCLVRIFARLLLVLLVADQLIRNNHCRQIIGVALQRAISVTGPRIDVDLCVSTYSTLKSSSILGAYDIFSDDQEIATNQKNGLCDYLRTEW